MSTTARPDRETAYRLFAAEFDDASLSYAESDEERAPNYVVTPTGARVNRLFAVGVLTEVEAVNDSQLRARVVDPTGAFVVYAGQYQPEALSFLESASPPAFVAVTGKARTFQPEDSDRVFTSVRPESLSEVDASTRDRFVVDTARRTLERVATIRDALARDERGDDLRAALEDDGADVSLAAGVPRALAHYGTTTAYLDAIEEMALDAARVVAGDREEVAPLGVEPGTGGSERETSRTTSPDTGEAASVDETSTVDDTSSTDSSAELTAESESDSRVEADSEETTTSDEDEPPIGSEPPAESTDESSATETETDTEPLIESDSSDEPDEAEELDEPGEPMSPSTDESEASANETDLEEPTAGDDEGIESSESVDRDAPDGHTDSPEEPEVDADLDNPEEFELDDEIREQVENQYGTEFETAADVDEPGAADIETPTPDPEPDDSAASTDSEADADDPIEADPATETAADSDAETQPADPIVDAETEDDAEPDGSVDEVTETVEAADIEDEPADTGDETDTAETESADVDPEEAVVTVMRELDDGDGAEREAVVGRVVEEYGLTPEDADDGIQSALMSGECYEPNDDTLKPI